MSRERTYAVDTITKGTNDTVSFYISGVLQRAFSSVKKMPERDSQGGMFIIITDIDERQFWFDVWEIINVNGTVFTRLVITDLDINTQYQVRINEIYELLCNDVFKGCCDSGGGGGGGDDEIISGIATGTDTYLCSPTSTIIEYSQEVLYRLEFTNGNTGPSTIDIAGLGVKTILKNGTEPLVSGDIPSGAVCVLAYDGVNLQLVSVSKDLQGLQDVITKDPVLTTDNSVDAGGHNFEITETDTFAVISKTVSGVASGIQSEPDYARLDAVDNGAGATVAAVTAGGVAAAYISALDGAGGETGLLADGTRVNIKTPDVDDAIDPTGKVLTAINSAGDVEFQTPSGGVTEYTDLTDATTVDLPTVNTPLSNALSGKVDENSAIVGATKTKVTYDAKGLVTGGADATTADIADSTDKRYVTDAEQTVIGNTSGTNTGDNAANTTSNAYADAKVADAIADGVTTIAPSQNAVFDALANKANLFSFFTTYGNTIGASSTRYFSISGGTGSTTEAAIEIKVIHDFTATGIGVRTSTAQSGLGAITVTLRKNGANTAITFTIAAGSAAGYFSDTAHTVSFVAGDTICLACVNAAAATSANIFNGTLTGK